MFVILNNQILLHIMAVFTTLTKGDINDLLNQYSIGELIDFQGIAAGIENTNYFVTTTNSQYVLTVFEKLTSTQLPFYLEFMAHLAAQNIPVPAPQRTHSGAVFTIIKDKPCAIATRLPGVAVMQPNAIHCQEMGSLLARMHIASKDYTGKQPNLRGLSWWHETTPSVLPFLTHELQVVLQDELSTQTNFAKTVCYQNLTQSAVHADMFCDNALFVGERLGGVIDFYFAGVDAWLFDLAVCVNDWCVNPDGSLDIVRASALINAYAQVNPFSDNDRQAWGLMLRAAALRFWLSRLYDFYLPREASMLTPKDPTHFERILLQRRTQLEILLP